MGHQFLGHGRDEGRLGWQSPGPLFGASTPLSSAPLMDTVVEGSIPWGCSTTREGRHRFALAITSSRACHDDLGWALCIPNDCGEARLVSDKVKGLRNK